MQLTRKQVEQRVAAFAEAGRRQGIKATHQRMEILRELSATEEHPDAEAIFTRVRRRLPSISLDTVYRTLRMLEEKGVISRVPSMQDRARFDANMNRHHHFVCEACGRISDFYSAELDHFAPPPEVAALGRVESVHIELRGKCKTCRRKGRA